MEECPFCNIDRAVVLRNEVAFAIYDKYAVSKGHVLVIPFRHVADYFDLTLVEKNAVWALVKEVKVFLEEKFRPDGFNVGFNVGESAGQTVRHVHVHVIPRYEGDVEDPTGGVRGCVPEKRVYNK